MRKALIAGLGGGIALNLVLFLTFRRLGFGMRGDGILLDPSIQSPKLIAVWTTIEPLPLTISKPVVMFAGLTLFGVLHAFIYRSIAGCWAAGTVRRAIRFAALLFALTFLFWEFFTPFNQFGEPLRLIALELLFWACAALAESFAISFVMERT